MTRARLWTEFRPFLLPTIIVVIYAVVRLVFVEMAGQRGVITPGHVGVDATLAVLAFVTLVLRMMAMVVAPIIVIYRLVMRGARRWTQPATPTTSSRK